MLSSTQTLIDFEGMENLASEILSKKKSIQLGIVLGGGNFWRGRENKSLGLLRAKSDSVGMLATVMNAISFSAFLEKKGVKTAVFSARSLPSFCDEFSLDRAEKAFLEDRICFFCGGTGNPFFTTDSASVLRAVEIGADMYAKATTVDGVYSADPKKDPNAVRYDTISFQEVLSQGLAVMDTSAFALAQENNLSLQVFNGMLSGNIARVLQGDCIGTLVQK